MDNILLLNYRTDGTRPISLFLNFHDFKAIGP